MGVRINDAFAAIQHGSGIVDANDSAVRLLYILTHGQSRGAKRAA